MPLKKEIKLYRRFITTICLTVTLALSGALFGVNFETRRMIQEENIIQARALFNSIIVARKWNADYGGVYVKKTPGVYSSTFLKNPDIHDSHGNQYTLRIPAIMTRELSVIAEQSGLFKFHITSLKPLNPQNAPDAFERESLGYFENGKKEFSRTELVDGRSLFRYIAPLYVEKSCLDCHAQQGYQLGEVRGGISVSFDVEHTREKLTQNLIMIAFFGALSVFSLVGLIYFFTRRFIKKIADARQEIERLATVDGLTGVYNRRYGMGRFEEEFERNIRVGRSISCLMIDIDHFKRINDKYGHLIGDVILKKVATCIMETLRPYDVLLRFGGEEFMLVLPETELSNAVKIGERIRMIVIERTAGEIAVTVSIGVTGSREGESDLNVVINRADEALYHAKSEGRNRVEMRS